MGSLAHYMTYSGVLMLVLVRGRGPAALLSAANGIWPAIAVPALARRAGR